MLLTDNKTFMYVYLQVNIRQLVTKFVYILNPLILHETLKNIELISVNQVF